jgi:hypothetical protein
MISVAYITVIIVSLIPFIVIYIDKYIVLFYIKSIKYSHRNKLRKLSLY